MRVLCAGARKGESIEEIKIGFAAYEEEYFQCTDAVKYANLTRGGCRSWVWSLWICGCGMEGGLL